MMIEFRADEFERGRCRACGAEDVERFQPTIVIEGFGSSPGQVCADCLHEFAASVPAAIEEALEQDDE